MLLAGNNIAAGSLAAILRPSTSIVMHEDEGSFSASASSFLVKESKRTSLDKTMGIRRAEMIGASPAMSISESGIGSTLSATLRTESHDAPRITAPTRETEPRTEATALGEPAFTLWRAVSLELGLTRVVFNAPHFATDGSSPFDPGHVQLEVPSETRTSLVHGRDGSPSSRHRQRRALSPTRR